jgi:hypothetical protein
MLLEQMDGLDSSAIPIHMQYLERSAAALQKTSYIRHRLLQSLRTMLGPDVTSDEEDI